MEESLSLFEVDENGQLVIETVENDLEVDDGNVLDSNVDSGNIPAIKMEDEEIFEEAQETVVFSLGSEPLPVVLSDEVTTALLDAVTPAGGAIASSTLDYFDRIVSGLPSDTAYVAYRIDSDSNYDGILYYSDDYKIDGDTVIFEGDNATTVRVERVSNAGYASTTKYYNYSGKDITVNLSRSGDVVYYSNVQHGFPVLGGLEKPLGISAFLVVGLVSALAVTVLSKLFRQW